MVGRVVFSLTGWKIYFYFIDQLAPSTRCIFKPYATKLMYQIMIQYIKLKWIFLLGHCNQSNLTKHYMHYYNIVHTLF